MSVQTLKVYSLEKVLTHNRVFYNTRNFFDNRTSDKSKRNTLLNLMDVFLDHRRFVENVSDSTVIKDKDCVKNIVKRLGDINVESIDMTIVNGLRRTLIHQRLSKHRQASFINTLKVYLRYCRDELGLEVMDYTKLKSPKIPERISTYLTDKELSDLINIIQIYNKDGSINIVNLRSRLLIEFLKGTGVRISEALGVKLVDIDFNTKEVKIIGKGNKQRITYLDDRVINLIQQYLKVRNGNNEYLFVTQKGDKKMSVHDIWRLFKKCATQAGINKKLTSHMLRRTFATKLMNNGADIYNVSKLLGHADIKTTIKYYIGFDQQRLKDTHEKYLKYNLN